MRRFVRAAALVFALALLAFGIGTCALPRPGVPAVALVRGARGGAVVTAVADDRYRSGGLRRAMLGGGWREAWAAPVRVEVLDLSSVGGGLKPVRRGGGRQTRSLHLEAADGREFAFRSLDKDQAAGLGALRRVMLGPWRQDQVGALHPGAVLAASALEDAAGVLHPAPRLAVLPDDPALGEHRADFGGLLGVLQEHPDDGFAGAEKVVGAEGLRRELAEHPEERVDARAYLTARLLDVYLGDWDRHDDQWRWARFGEDGARRWVPIARDRDYAFSDYRGILASLARVVDPKIVRFDGEYRDLGGLLVKAREMDRAHLCPLPSAAWDSAALALRTALADSAIAAAVRRMPPEYVVHGGDALERTLRLRRDNLPAAARRFRASLHDGHCAVSSKPPS